MIRRIVLSRSYQMSSQADPAAMEADPKIMLWHHRSPKRLEGEAIRDSLLALSGRLDSKQFGAPVPIHLTSFMDGRGRPGTSGPLDGWSSFDLHFCASELLVTIHVNLRLAGTIQFNGASQCIQCAGSVAHFDERSLCGRTGKAMADRALESRFQYRSKHRLDVSICVRA